MKNAYFYGLCTGITATVLYWMLAEGETHLALFVAGVLALNILCDYYRIFSSKTE